jgi:ABC-type multidrug transport system ATPase subunit/ABC-type multidrug transport system permease subunit
MSSTVEPIYDDSHEPIAKEAKVVPEGAVPINTTQRISLDIEKPSIKSLPLPTTPLPLPAGSSLAVPSQAHADAAARLAHAAATVSLSWKDLHYTVPTPDGKGKRTLLRGLTGTAPAGRLLVIMGPSGAGKSTMLNAISGRLTLQRGSHLDGYVCLNDVLFSNALKRVLAFVAQDDIVMTRDTPSDAFDFALSMRHQSPPAAEKAALVEAMLQKLRLVDCRDTIMGIPGVVKGVSGGEKKRTNIGVELITNPPVVMLDEPTSGLDSVSALRIGELLREIAHREGRTVVCTLHTPSSELYQVFDDLMLMARGAVIFHGPRDGAKLFFASAGYPVPPRENPSEYYMRLLQSPPEVLDRLEAAWAAYTKSDEGRASPVLQPPPAALRAVNKDLSALVERRRPTSFPLQLYHLFKRGWRNTMRDPILTNVRFAQTLIFGVFMGLMYINLTDDDNGVQDRQGCLSILVMHACFMTLFPALMTFPVERPIFLADMMSELYSPAAYYWAKTFVMLPESIIIPFLYGLIAYFMADLTRTAEQFFIFSLIMVTVALTAQALGAVISAAFQSLEVALAFGPFVMMPIILMSGQFANTDRLEPGWVWLMHLSFVRYAFKGVIRNEFLNIPEGTLQGPIYHSGKEVVQLLNFTKEWDRWQVGIGMMFAIMAALRVLGTLSLMYHAYNVRSRLPYALNYAKSRGARVAAAARM